MLPLPRLQRLRAYPKSSRPGRAQVLPRLGCPHRFRMQAPLRLPARSRVFGLAAHDAEPQAGPAMARQPQTPEREDRANGGRGIRAVNSRTFAERRD